jgi:hypothetical protein
MMAHTLHQEGHQQEEEMASKWVIEIQELLVQMVDVLVGMVQS